ncbi:MAG: TonB family protein [Candidatus Eisenbacteria bacterium]|nr:TonB family protein [Candidatus Eisenbacteria bacterium]
MRTTLFEFMPYGAPELIEARTRHEARALALASAGAITLLAVAIAIVPLLPREVTLAQVAPGPTTIDRAPTILPPLPPPIEVHKISPSKPTHVPAVPLPVPDPTAPPVLPNPNATGMTNTSSSPIGVPSTEPGPVVDPNARPGINDVVFVEEFPAAIRQVKPVYPDIAMQAGVEGTVLVRALVGRDGRVLDARVDPKHSVTMLDEAALDAARQWIFTPGLSNHQPVMCWVSIPFRFQLH